MKIASTPVAPRKPAGSYLGRLEWQHLLQWLREDGVVAAADAERTRKRFGAGSSAQHPLVRLGNAGLADARTGRTLDTEALTQWLAGRAGLPYLRIDPLKVDVGRVADVMSINYAEARRALPLQYGATEVTVATCEPFDTGWLAEIAAHTKRTIRLVVASPQELQRYTTEFYTLARSVRAAQKSGEAASSASFEQLVELGNIELRVFDAGEPLTLSDRLSVTPVAVPHRAEWSDAHAFVVRGPTRRLLWCPDIDRWDDLDGGLRRLLIDHRVDLACLDATFLDAGELGGRDMRDVPHPLAGDTLSLIHISEPTRPY